MMMKTFWYLYHRYLKVFSWLNVNPLLRLLDTYAAKTHKNWPPLRISLNNSALNNSLIRASFKNLGDTTQNFERWSSNRVEANVQGGLLFMCLAAYVSSNIKHCIKHFLRSNYTLKHVCISIDCFCTCVCKPVLTWMLRTNAMTRLPVPQTITMSPPTSKCLFPKNGTPLINQSIIVPTISKN